MLRLVPGGAAVTTISALDVLRRGDPDPWLAGSIVLIGGSAPELGGLRPSPDDPLMPSVMLHAAAVSQLLRGIVPLPLPCGRALAMGLGANGAAAGLFAGIRFRPTRGAVAIAGFSLALVTAALAAAAGDRLFDPSMPIVLASACFAATALVTAAETQLREARIRRCFWQHLAPEGVELIAARPSVLKLAGELGEITALFTDVERFTALTHRPGPEALVTMLDDYFEGVTRIIIEHGGMVDKLVGDAVHAFFNMPLDLPGHPMKAVACAIAIRTWTELYRLQPGPSAPGFARTRVGI